eukprot:m.137237 g.137237  ORF g.137237 m.137237 type:complete len:1324 (-) comp29913_c0_seq5:2-3973(-)
MGRPSVLTSLLSMALTIISMLLIGVFQFVPMTHACRLTCDLSDPDACQGVQVQVEDVPVLWDFYWSFEDNVLQPYYQVTTTWTLTNQNITSVGQNISHTCFDLADGVSEADRAMIGAVNLADNFVSMLPNSLVEMFSDDFAWISFKNNSLSSIPKNFLLGYGTPTSALSISLDENELSSIEQITAGFGGQILNMSLSSNHLTFIANNSFADFAGYDLIVHLDSNAGSILEIPAGLLSGYNGVRLSIHLESNRLTSIPETLIQNYGGESLYLYLDNNNISDIPSGTFTSTTPGQHVFLFFENNSISVLDPCLFQDFKGKGLNLFFAWNNIEELPNNAFGSGYDCTSSADDDVGNGAGFTAADLRIDLQRNRIKHLGTSPFAYTSTTIEQMVINLAYNEIETIPSDFFLMFYSIGNFEIDFSNNYIHTVNYSAFDGFDATSLNIDFTNNSITEFINVQAIRVTQFQIVFDQNKISQVGNGFLNFPAPVAANISLANNSLETPAFISLIQSYQIGSGSVSFNFDLNLIDEFPNLAVAAQSSENGHAGGKLSIVVSNNKITRIGSEAFFDFPGSELKVDFHNNPLAPFPDHLNLTANGFVSKRARIFDFSALSVNLSATGVGTEALGAFSTFGGSSLTIDLSYNHISSVNISAVQSLNNAFNMIASTINLNNNDISFLPINSLLQATVINLAYNKLTIIESHTFARSTSTRSVLEDLDVSNNQLTYLSETAFGSSATQLRSLDLANNSLQMVLTGLAMKTPNLALCNMANNMMMMLPFNNRIFQRKNFDNNPLSCSAYWPAPSKCTCNSATRPFYLEYCDYALCNEFATLCPADKPLLDSNCSIAPSFRCKAACGVGEYLTLKGSTAAGVGVCEAGIGGVNPKLNQSSYAICIPITTCATSFDGMQAYEFKPPTTTTDRVCAPCSTCPTGYHKTACTATSDSACSRISRAGDTAAIVMGVLVGFIGATSLLFLWGRRHKESKRAVTSTLYQRTQDLEMAEKLLVEEETKTQEHEESWKAHWGDVTIHRVLGEGTFGVVHLGEWLRTSVAVKIIRKTVVTLDDDSDSFRQEMTTMQRLHHPHLVSFFGYGTTDKGQPFLLTELMKGTLKDFLHERGATLSWTDRRRFLADIASGMLFLHTRDPPMIHRDLKSDNCLIGDNNTIKIADFGTVTRPSAGNRPGSPDASYDLQASNGSLRSLGDQSLTSASTWFTMTATLGAGTPLWMAPEVLDGKHGSAHYGSPVDVYSYGICMWEIATGRIPYQGQQDVSSSQFGFADHVRNGGRPHIPPNIPSQYLKLMQLCWAGDPTLRPTFSDIGSAVSRMHTQEL